MGKISKTIELVGTYKSKKIEAMFDTGAKNNFLPYIFKDGETIEELGFKEFFGTHSFFMANESITKGDIVRFNELRIDNLRIRDPIFVILDQLVDDAIVGTQLMQDNRAIIRLGDDTLLFR